LNRFDFFQEVRESTGMIVKTYAVSKLARI
jgi:hypothetical protein